MLFSRFLTVSFLLASAALFSDRACDVAASSENGTKGPAPSSLPKKPLSETEIHRIQVGANYTYAWVTPSGNPTLTGSLGGLQGIYEYRPLNTFYGALAFDWRQGNTSHEGSDRSILDLNAQERMGYTYARSDHPCKASFFTGLGWRYMHEDVSVHSASVDFNYVHFYVPIGFVANYTIHRAWDLGLNFQWRPQVYPAVQIVPLNGARWMLDYRLDNFMVEIPVTYAWNYPQLGLVGLTISPYFEVWHDGASFAKTLTGLHLSLPGNRYYFVGVDVNVAWKF